MSYPSGSTLKVLLDNGASPNTGPFDLYVNSITASSNGILIANDVPKNDLSSSGYTFVTPIETFQVWAKSDGSITNADVYVLGEVPGYNKSVAVTASYDSSLTPGLITASIFLDNGYGPHFAGTIPSALNSCPSTTGVGTSSLNSAYNTVVYLKDNETGSNYIKFTANGSATSDYYYHIPAFSGSGVNIISTNICVDLSGGGYQTVATNSINIYPTASIKPNLEILSVTGYTQVQEGLIIKVNGNTSFSGSITGSATYSPISVPGNAFIEVTSSVLQPSIWDPGDPDVTSRNVLNIRWSYNNGEYSNASVSSIDQTQSLSGSAQANIVQYSFYAVPGASYTTNFSSSYSNVYPEFAISATAGNGEANAVDACNLLLGNQVYTRGNIATVNDIIVGTRFVTNQIGTYVDFAGADEWYAVDSSGSVGPAPFSVQIDNTGTVITKTTCA
jgi:hypothetical protein